ncbi:hypothetical protein LMH87_011534 [Akanthomyces muscarius]|uniref:Uncharacterized protein n=1 Tax=Akanthomyces muscarius TaxID=2231603 RepID=A0A9W8UL80_AKAMU|nr:hypothetical protein LMH87_011534 [Akanthomyces muscarius]KAJ4150800.1 hypothetical protein LMH87_011534 [Akanthomyces muscarius]
MLWKKTGKWSARHDPTAQQITTLPTYPETDRFSIVSGEARCSWSLGHSTVKVTGNITGQRNRAADTVSQVRCVVASIRGNEVRNLGSFIDV